MQKRIQRQTMLSPDDAAHARKIRAEFASKPSKSQLLRSGDYLAPMSIEEYVQWRKLNKKSAQQ